MKMLLLFSLLVISLSTKAQKSDSTHTHYSFYRGLSTHETTLKTKHGVKNGVFKLLSAHKTIATGLYKDDVRVGRWAFFDNRDSLSQVYNYSTKKVEYNRAYPGITGEISELKIGDRVIYPVKIGGYLGIQFLIKFFDIPLHINHQEVYKVIYKFKIDKEGKLTNYEVSVRSANGEKTEKIPLKRLKPEDFEFVPAKVNGINVDSQLIFELNIDE